MLGIQRPLDSTMDELRETIGTMLRGDENVKSILVLIHMPTCPYCRAYYDEFEQMRGELPTKYPVSVKSITTDAFDNDNDNLGYSFYGADTVPGVFLLHPNTPKDDVDVEDLRQRRERESIIHHLESRFPPKSVKKPVKKSVKKSVKKTEQKGKGVVEGAIASGILAGVAMTPAIQKALIGLSKATQEVAKGSIQKINPRELMKTLKKATMKRKSTKKSTKKNKTRKH